ncbi:hypothetical protein [Pseudoalteromonas sp. BDTF-M6]|uniref:hypothetical protein n=1 Tax=Pseudoalteromonas sp. BDTF-M6 TaxID=2796132 RepID=UPI001BAF08B7|nr:hypothetical protein [Pseudoalteromonas sp. BDTF-M6]MBS3796530.1 hypothetical protein [Pseudoalteromonas sp. BDTF-M6]
MDGTLSIKLLWLRLFLITLLPGCVAPSQIEDFNLEYKGVFEKYSYRSESYEKNLCSDEGDYRATLRLNRTDVASILREAEKIKFFELPKEIKHSIPSFHVEYPDENEEVIYFWRLVP